MSTTVLKIVLVVAMVAAMAAITVGAVLHQADMKAKEEQKAKEKAREKARERARLEGYSEFYTINDFGKIEVSTADWEGQVYRDIYTGITVTSEQDIIDKVMPAMREKEQVYLRAKLSKIGITIDIDVAIPTYDVEQFQRKVCPRHKDEEIYDELHNIRGHKRLVDSGEIGNLVEARTPRINGETTKESHCNVRQHKVLLKQARKFKREQKWSQLEYVLDDEND